MRTFELSGCLFPNVRTLNLTTNDTPTIFLQLLLIEKQRKIELGPLFAYALCSVPPTLIDGQGCLRKSSKSDLVKRLGVIDISAKSADTIIVDVSQLFNHISWPYGGSPSDLIVSIEERLSNYPDANKSVVLDKYQDVSSKDHERMRKASEVVIDYELSVASHLPKRDAIMKSKSNKRKLASVLGTLILRWRLVMMVHFSTMKLMLQWFPLCLRQLSLVRV